MHDPMELLDFFVTLKLYVDRVRVCLVFICHFVAIEQLQSCQEGFHSMRLVSAYCGSNVFQVRFLVHGLTDVL